MANQEVVIKVESGKKRKFGCCGGIVIAILLFFLLCVVIGVVSSSRQKTPDTPQQSSEPAKQEIPAQPESVQPQESKQPEQPDQPEQPKKPEKSEFEQLLEKHEEKLRSEMPFVDPKVGDNVKFKIDGGTDIQGKIYQITETNIRVGDDSVQMGIELNRINPEHRAMLDRSFYEVYVKNLANELALQELAKLEQERKAAAEAAEKRREEQAEKRRIQANASQFRRNFESSFNGSIRPVVNAVKAGMHDPGSFEHVSTRWYILKGTEDQYIVYMKFRGKNAFGALVLNEVTAICLLDGTVVSLKMSE